MFDANALVGKRALLKILHSWGSEEAREYKILEVSPSGDWVKLKKRNVAFWEAVTNIFLVEVLD